MGIRFRPARSILVPPFASSRQTRYAQTKTTKYYFRVSTILLSQMARQELPWQATIPSIS